MIDTFLAEITLVPTRVRLAIKEILVKRLERIAVLYQRSHAGDAKVTMPTIHSNALASLKSSISQDRALIAERKGEAHPVNENPESIKPEDYGNSTPAAHPGSVNRAPKSVKQRQERDKKKSRRKSYMK